MKRNTRILFLGLIAFLPAAGLEAQDSKRQNLKSPNSKRSGDSTYTVWKPIHRIHKGFSFYERTIAVLKTGDKVQKLEQKGKWWKVSFQAGTDGKETKTGWTRLSKPPERKKSGAAVSEFDSATRDFVAFVTKGAKDWANRFAAKNKKTDDILTELEEAQHDPDEIRAFAKEGRLKLGNS